ncbi:MAG: formimidoylglutamase [Cryomorphaceae bacterium]|nr:formimidoylglutamase [Cryomorphaceae bacterium]
MISSDFLAPVSNKLLEKFSTGKGETLGYNIGIHREIEGLPDLTDVKIVLLGILEDRLSVANTGCDRGVDAVRNYFYKLYPGEWNIKIADIGNIYKGDTPEDTYAAFRYILKELLHLDIIPVILGGSQEATYHMYRVYDEMEQSVNLVCADPRFDLGDFNLPLNDENYLSHIVLQKPHNLYNFGNLGHQSYFVNPGERDLMGRMYFDTYRIGQLRPFAYAEPVLRNSDIVSIDMSVVRAAEAPGHRQASPNGLNGEEICALTRYAGLSDKLSQIGIYGYNPGLDINGRTAQLMAEMIWYFIEGVNYRKGDFPIGSKKNYARFTVLLEEGYELIFYKSDKSGRWWIEAPIEMASIIQHERHRLIPCNVEDYDLAMQGEIPQVWWNALKRLD